MKKTILIFTIAVLSITAAAYAFQTSKPEDHTAAWVDALHGKQANVNSADCYVCHTDRLECITCHEDTKPRDHTVSWTNKTHGMEARWNRDRCATCHQEDSCISCHESVIPNSHNRSNFNNPPGAHCNTSCQQNAVGNWRNSISKDCLVCHTRKPLPTHVPQ